MPHDSRFATAPRERVRMVYFVYQELMDQIRDGTLKQLTLAIRPEQTLSAGDEVTFESLAARKTGGDAAATAEDDSITVTLATAREMGEKRGYKLWQVSWE